MDTSANVPFSARNRGSQKLIDNEFPGSARVGLLHLLNDAVQNEYLEWGAVALELRRIGREEPVQYSPHSREEERLAKADVEDFVDKLPWDKMLDFCERVHSKLAREVGHGDFNDGWITDISRGEVQGRLAADIEHLFREENLAFEFKDGLVVRRGRKHTTDRATRAEMLMRDLRLENARKHFAKAQRYFRDSKKPDPENAVKEAVCAVEAAAKELFPDLKGSTLDDRIKGLVGGEPGKLPKPLSQTFLGLYGFRNGGDGVAHGGASAGPATMEIAEYALAIAASQIILLSDLFSVQDTDIPF